MLSLLRSTGLPSARSAALICPENPTASGTALVNAAGHRTHHSAISTAASGGHDWCTATRLPELPPASVCSIALVASLRFGRKIDSIVSRWKLVDTERRFVALDIYLQHMVDRLPNLGQLIERAAEKLLLLHPIDTRDDDDQAGV